MLSKIGEIQTPLPTPVVLLIGILAATVVQDQTLAVMLLIVRNFFGAFVILGCGVILSHRALRDDRGRDRRCLRHDLVLALGGS